MDFCFVQSHTDTSFKFDKKNTKTPQGKQAYAEEKPDAPKRHKTLRLKKQVRHSQLILRFSLQNEGGSGRVLLGNPESVAVDNRLRPSAATGAEPLVILEKDRRLETRPPRTGSFLSHLDLGGVPQVRLLAVVLG